MALTAWAVVPEPTAWLAVEVKAAKVGLVPHSNQAFVASPFGLALPFSTAPLAVTPVASAVVTVGADPDPPVVVKLTIEPFVVPAELELAAR